VLTIALFLLLILCLQTSSNTYRIGFLERGNPATSGCPRSHDRINVNKRPKVGGFLQSEFYEEQRSNLDRWSFDGLRVFSSTKHVGKPWFWRSGRGRWSSARRVWLGAGCDFGISSRLSLQSGNVFLILISDSFRVSKGGVPRLFVFFLFFSVMVWGLRVSISCSRE